MPALKFTVRNIDSLKATENLQTDYWDESLSGFGLRVTRSGGKTWLLRYRHNGRRRRFKLGTYPILSLADAREQARDALHNLTQGIDPAANRIENRNAETFAELVDDYLERHAKPNKKSWKEDERILNKEVIPRWKNIKAKEVTRRDILNLLDDTVKRGAPVHANRVLALVRKVFNFGIQREVVIMNPCQVISRPTKEHARERVLISDEICMVWEALEKEDILISSIFKIYILTAQRGIEVRSMAWADLDLETQWWTIPGSKTKNGLAHRVPLSPQVIKIIRSVSFTKKFSPWVFPSPIDPSKHIDHTQKAIQRIQTTSKVDFVGHDFRRTASSHMAGLGIQRLVISKILNHVEPGVTKVYERHSYDQEKRAALDMWGEFIERTVAAYKIKIAVTGYEFGPTENLVEKYRNVQPQKGESRVG